MYFYTVKKQLKIGAFLNLLILYCLIISFYSGNPVNDYAGIPNKSNTEYLAPKVLSDFVYQAEQTESFIGLHRNIPRITFKNHFTHFSSCFITSELLLFNSFSLCKFFSEDPFLQFKESDIIFPFHYFW